MHKPWPVFHANSTLLSPRRWSQPPTGPNMLIMRPGAERASRVLACEAAAAMGLNPAGIEDLQSAVGNAITDTYADAVLQRFAQRAQLLGLAQAQAIAAPTVSLPAPPPMERPSAKKDAPARTARGMPTDQDTLHAAFGHVSHDRLVHTCAQYGLPRPRGDTRSPRRRRRPRRRPPPRQRPRAPPRRPRVLPAAREPASRRTGCDRPGKPAASRGGAEPGERPGSVTPPTSKGM